MCGGHRSLVWAEPGGVGLAIRGPGPGARLVCRLPAASPARSFSCSAAMCSGRRQQPRIPGLGVKPVALCPSAFRQAIARRTGESRPSHDHSQDQRVGPCRLDRPTPKLRRELAIRREIPALVPPSQYQAPRANPGQICAQQRRSPTQRMVWGNPTGAAVGTGIQRSLGSAPIRDARCDVHLRVRSPFLAPPRLLRSMSQSGLRECCHSGAARSATTHPRRD